MINNKQGGVNFQMPLTSGMARRIPQVVAALHLLFDRLSVARQILPTLFVN
jgi:hypothetical protein